MLERYPDAELVVYGIWLPLSGGHRGAIDTDIFDDPRAPDFWDAELVSASWFGEHDTARVGLSILWDAYLLFRPDARWDAEPTGLVASGASTIGNTGALERELPALLAR